MLDLGTILENIWGSFARPPEPQSNLYWLFFFSAAGIVFIIYWLRRYDKEDVSFGGFLAFCFPKRIYTHASAKLDFKYCGVNTVVYGLLIVPLFVASASAAHATFAIMTALFGDLAAPLPGSVWADLGVTVATVVAADFAFFCSHYLQHRVPLLWEFHKVHHAAEVLHPVTLCRVHPVDTAVDVTAMGAASGAVLGLSAYFFGDSVEVVTILGTNAVVFLFNFLGVHLRHSHVRLSYGPFLDRIFISPTMHQTHHSCAPQHLGKNIGGILALWDWLAGTLYLPREDEELPLGLTDGEHLG
jgi:sterol desaturase/sphingolipid hydroxylase (fatty acid hydroxylase superfamily)